MYFFERHSLTLESQLKIFFLLISHVNRIVLGVPIAIISHLESLGKSLKDIGSYDGLIVNEVFPVRVGEEIALGSVLIILTINLMQLGAVTTQKMLVIVGYSQ